MGHRRTDFLTAYFAAARAHGEAGNPEHECGDLQELAVALWRELACHVAQGKVADRFARFVAEWEEPEPEDRQCAKCGEVADDDSELCVFCGVQAFDQSITRCSVCGEPAHAGETDDLDRCEECRK